MAVKIVVLPFRSGPARTDSGDTAPAGPPVPADSSGASSEPASRACAASVDDTAMTAASPAARRIRRDFP